MTEQLVIELWREILDIDYINSQDNFFDLGGDSLGAITLTARIYQRTGTDLPVSTLFTNPTVHGFTQALITNQPETTDIVLRTEAHSPILYFFHGDWTGGGLYTREIVKALKPGLGIVALHPHGLSGQPLPQTIETMAQRYIDIIHKHQKKGPYFLTGHCSGALVAYEIAKQLQSKGEEVRNLILIDPATPSFDGTNICSEKDIRNTFSGKTANDIRILDTDTRANIILDAYYKLCKGYVVAPYSGDTLLILAQNSQTVTEGRAAGWKSYIPSLKTVIVPGNHFSILTKHADALADRLHKSVTQAIEDDITY